MAVTERENREEGVPDSGAKAAARRKSGRPGNGGLLGRNRDFRQLWYAETTGKFGAAVTGVLLPLAAVSALHAGTFEVSLLNAATWVPWLVIGLPAGVWVDRLRRRTVMLASDAVSCALFVIVPLAHRSGVLDVGGLLLAALLAGTAAVFFQTAYTARLPGIVGVADQAEGNAKLHGSASAAQLAGTGAAGLIAQAAGAVDGMLTNAATFLVSFVCVARIRRREPPPPVVVRTRGALFKEVGEGVRLVARDPYLRSLTFFGAASNLFLGGCQTLLVVFLLRDVGLSGTGVGVLVAIGGAGGVLGALVVRRGVARFGTARALLLFELGVPALAPLMALTTRGAGLALFVAGYASASVGVVAGNVIKAGFHQAYCPPGVLGRVSACSSFLNYGTLPLGALLAGGLGTWLGVRPTLWLMTAGIPLTALILLCSPIRTRRDLPTRAEATDRAGHSL
ncbi:MFS transporter [Streptomyces sp. VNUA116]|uniref:MFS transporter n=1 Tax=Streptomyces sp. VNUA116 TaxID=3062449 RepID=UPI002675B1FC|nr:MFS transporter [Streptomyces sp. VNUA116]WKU48168.1 MFS transporter [Streptomyces sp. VNUA116]